MADESPQKPSMSKDGRSGCWLWVIIGMVVVIDLVFSSVSFGFLGYFRGSMSGAPWISGTPGPGTSGGFTPSGPCAQQIVSYANSAVGNPTSAYYSTDPRKACASFVSAILNQAGAMSGTFRGVDGLWDNGQGEVVIPKYGNLDLNILQPGDVVFFKGTGEDGLTHTGIYVGGNQFVNTSSSHLVVVKATLSTYMGGSHFAGAKRYCKE